jgi:hypothetical protein
MHHHICIQLPFNDSARPDIADANEASRKKQ